MYNRLTHPKYRADIDGLRALAVLAVLGFHAFPRWVRGGFVGVDVFFVISGFLISTIIFDNLEHHTFSFAEFYARRIRRIFPALLIALSACLVVGWAVLLPDEFNQLCKHIFGGAGFVSNFILWSEIGYFDNAASTKPLIHLWSLGIEEQFYLLWPVLLWVSWKRKWNPLIVIAVIAGASFVANIVDTGRDPSGAFYLPQARFWELLMGAALARIQSHKYELPLRGVLSTLGFALIVAGVLLISAGAPFPGWRALLPTVGAASIMAAEPRAWINRHVFSSRAAVWVGSISYPLYLWHWPLLSFAWIIEGHQPPLVMRAIGLCLSFPLAWATTQLVEKPIRLGRHGSLKAASLASAMFLMGIIACAGYWHLGFAARLERAHGIESVLNNWAHRRAALAVRIDANCEDVLKNKDAHLYCQLPSRAPSKLIIGDSHAIAFAQSQVLNKNPDVGVVASYSCLPMIGYATADPKENIEDQKKNCSKMMADAIYLARALPSIKMVILVARGGYKHQIEPIRGASNETPDSSFVAGYTEAIAAFQRLNKKVAFVLDVPDISMDPTGCVDVRSVRLGLQAHAREDCAVPIDVVHAQQGHYKELTSLVLARTTGVEVFDTDDVLCDTGKCYGGRDSTIYYYDETHLSEAGSELVFNAFARWLDRIP